MEKLCTYCGMTETPDTTLCPACEADILRWLDTDTEQTAPCVSLFKTLSPQEEQSFIDYATNNNPENMAKWSIYHPVARKVWIARGIYPPERTE